MHQILIVDDDHVQRELIRDGLSVHESLGLLTAADGLEAKRVLQTHDVDLVLTDLHMPKMDGFALIAYLRQNHARVPVIVMSNDFSPTLRDQLLGQGCLRCLKKPVVSVAVAEVILKLLASKERGYVQGMSIASFLQMLAMERKTCTLEVSADERTGRLWLLDGKLVDAELDAQRGEPAAMEVIAWEVAETIAIDNVCEVGNPTVTTELNFLIMESMRLKDEAVNQDGRPAADQNQAAEPGDDLELVDGTPVFDASALNDFPPDLKASLRRHLIGLREVHGYRAAAILLSGEILVSDSVESDLNLVRVCGMLHDAARTVYEASASAGLAAGEELVLRTPVAIAAIQHHEIDSGSDLQLQVVLGARGEESQMRAWMKRILPEIRSEILLVIAPELVLPED